MQRRQGRDSTNKEPRWHTNLVAANQRTGQPAVPCSGGLIRRPLQPRVHFKFACSPKCQLLTSAHFVGGTAACTAEGREEARPNLEALPALFCKPQQSVLAIGDI